MSENAKKIQELMNTHNIYGEIIEDSDSLVKVEIHWGDWKHEHLCLVWLVKENMSNFKGHDQITTEEDGTDCYSAIHTFFFN